MGLANWDHGDATVRVMAGCLNCKSGINNMLIST